MPDIFTDYPLTALNTFGLASQAEFFTEIDTVEQLQACIADPQLRALSWSILGGGSNLILAERVHGLVLKMNLQGKALSGEDDVAYYVRAAAGENWHEFVQWTLAQGWGGLENLSLIPGTVGASPVQNIGAYGLEVKDVFHQLEAVHLHTGEQKIFTLDECRFAYRDSVFKQEGAGVWCITAVTFRLPKHHQPKTSYGDIEQELASQQLEPSPANVAKAVIAVRQRKLPDPAVIGNVGSFFKNPLIPTTQAQALKAQFSGLVMYPVDQNTTKLAAGWLIEQAGWKGQSLGPVGMYAKQALVMVNHGGANAQAVQALESAVQASVRELFGVNIEAEPLRWN
jgi:UDP-N-acetylmuramate dehydrogenase